MTAPVCPKCSRPDRLRSILDPEIKTVVVYCSGGVCDFEVEFSDEDLIALALQKVGKPTYVASCVYCGKETEKRIQAACDECWYKEKPAEQPAPLTPEGIKSETVFALTCAECGVEHERDDYTPYFHSVNEALGEASDMDWEVRNDRLLCEQCARIDRLNAEESREVCGAYSHAESVARTGRPGGCTKPKGHEGNCGDAEEEAKRG